MDSKIKGKKREILKLMLKNTNWRLSCVCSLVCVYFAECYLNIFTVLVYIYIPGVFLKAYLNTHKEIIETSSCGYPKMRPEKKVIICIGIRLV